MKVFRTKLKCYNLHVESSVIDSGFSGLPTRGMGEELQHYILHYTKDFLQTL